MKVWRVVFCCMSSRAIHAELVNTQSTESFLMAFQRFAALRGYPRKIFSDPGTNFIGARPVLPELYTFLRIKTNHFILKECKEKIPSTVLHRDVRRLIVLLPVEEQVSVKFE